MPDEPTAPIPGVPTGSSTLVEALEELRDLGFDSDMYLTADGLVHCGSCGHGMAPADMDLMAIRRLEGVSDPGEMAAVLGLVCRACGTRGSLLVRFGPEASAAEDAVLRAVVDHRHRP